MLLYFGTLVIGAVAAFVNTVAGGGSLLTLPVLILAGVPPDIANGTNRVGVLVQSASAATTFRAEGVDPWPGFKRSALPLCCGAIGGAYCATVIDPEIFRQAVGAVLVAMVLVGGRHIGRTKDRPGLGHPVSGALALVGLGAYAGFIQAGIGVWLLLVLPSVLGGGLKQLNAVKVSIVGAATIVALAIFIASGQVDWPLGLCLALGGWAGGRVGARWASRVSEAALRRALLGAMILLALGMWAGPS